MRCKWSIFTWGKVLTRCRLKWSSGWWIRPSFTCSRGLTELWARRRCLAFCSWSSRTRSLILLRSRPHVQKETKRQKKICIIIIDFNTVLNGLGSQTWPSTVWEAPGLRLSQLSYSMKAAKPNLLTSLCWIVWQKDFEQFVQKILCAILRTVYSQQ